MIDYGIIETIIPIAYLVSIASFTNDTEFVVGSIISAALILSKFTNLIPNFVRSITWLVIVVIILNPFDFLNTDVQFYKCAIMIVMTYCPFHTLMIQYSGSFNLVELFALLNLNWMFVTYWIEKYIDFMCFGKVISSSNNKYAILESIRPNTAGYLPEILLFFCPYMITNWAVIIFLISIWITKETKYILSSLVSAVVLMFWIVMVSNSFSPLRFDVFGFLVSE